MALMPCLLFFDARAALLCQSEWRDTDPLLIGSSRKLLKWWILGPGSPHWTISATGSSAKLRKQAYFDDVGALGDLAPQSVSWCVTQTL